MQTFICTSVLSCWIHNIFIPQVDNAWNAPEEPLMDQEDAVLRNEFVEVKKPLRGQRFLRLPLFPLIPLALAGAAGMAGMGGMAAAAAATAIGGAAATALGVLPRLLFG